MRFNQIYSFRVKERGAKYYVLFLLYFFASNWQKLDAEEFKKKVEIKDCRLAIVAIGPKPPRRYGKDQSGSVHAASTLLPPRLGELPPKRLFMDLSDEKETGEETRSIDVSYNAKPTFITLPPHKTLKLRQKKEQGEERYLTLEANPAGSVNLILLSPSSLSPSRWNSEPKQFKIDLTNSVFQSKGLAFINLSKRSIRSKYHMKEVLLRSGQWYVHSVTSDRLLHQVSAHYGREDKTVFSSAVKLNKTKSINLFIFYDANPNTNDGRTVGLIRLRVNIYAEREKLVITEP